MGTTILKTALGPDGRQRADFLAYANGTYRFVVVQFYDADPENPHERPPGYWIPICQSGIYASLDDAVRDFEADGWPTVTQGADAGMTALEAAVLSRLLADNPALPGLSKLLVRTRENTGVGRYTYLDWTGEPFLEKHVITPPQTIVMDGVEADGLGAIVFVGPQELTLELFAYVGDWDGVERRWTIKESSDDR